MRRHPRIRLTCRKPAVLLLCVLGVLLTRPAIADTTLIVALGASNTEGKGVSPREAFPAVLEQMLRGQGYDVQIINAGISGDTPQGMLARLDSSVPPGTRVVILNPGGNDLRGCGRRRGGSCATPEEHAASVQQLVESIRARGIRVVMAKFGHLPESYRQADGRHLTPEAHRAVAVQLYPEVAAALANR
jgi:acyl-CoA thioesterase-1